ncbi:hypothetical protein V2G26_012332 [Clonostachys chloroleuca]
MAGPVVDLYVSIAIPLTAATFALVFRFVARRISKCHLWFDDYFALLAYILGWGYLVTVLILLTHFGFGQAPKPMDPDHAEEVLTKVRKLVWVNELMYASTIAFSKLSFLSLYWRIFKLTVIHIPIRLLLVACSAWFIIRTLGILFQCWPVPYIWDKNIKGGTCKLNMHLSWQQKVAIIGLFASGIIVVSCSVLVLIQVIMYKPVDASYTLSLVKLLLWGNAEVNLAIFCCCLPMLRPAPNWSLLNMVLDLLK